MTDLAAKLAEIEAARGDITQGESGAVTRRLVAACRALIEQRDELAVWAQVGGDFLKSERNAAIFRILNGEA